MSLATPLGIGGFIDDGVHDVDDAVNGFGNAVKVGAHDFCQSLAGLGSTGLGLVNTGVCGLANTASSVVPQLSGIVHAIDKGTNDVTDFGNEAIIDAGTVAQNVVNSVTNFATKIANEFTNSIAPPTTTTTAATAEKKPAPKPVKQVSSSSS